VPFRVGLEANKGSVISKFHKTSLEIRNMAGRLSRGMLQTDNKKYKQMTVPKLHEDFHQPKSYVTYPIKVDN